MTLPSGVLHQLWDQAAHIFFLASSIFLLGCTMESQATESECVTRISTGPTGLRDTCWAARSAASYLFSQGSHLRDVLSNGRYQLVGEATRPLGEPRFSLCFKHPSPSGDKASFSVDCIMDMHAGKGIDRKMDFPLPHRRAWVRGISQFCSLG